MHVGWARAIARLALVGASFALVASAAAQLPETPTRDSVVAALGPLHTQVGECATRYGAGHGRSYVAFVFRADGSVIDAQMEAPYAKTQFGVCVHEAAMRVRLPPFHQFSFRVRYPVGF